MKRIAILKVTLLLLVIANTSGFAIAESTDFDDSIAEVVTADNLAGMSAAVAKDGAIIWAGGAGFADVENEVPMRANTVHRIASISKPISAVGAMVLVQEGKLTLDDLARDHIQSWPEKYPPISVRQLLSHTSGIRHYRGVESSSMTSYPHLRRALHAFKDDALDANPGEKFIYTTYGYTLLGAVMESASMEKLHALLKRSVWEPAGMASTTFEFAGELVPHRSRGYSRDSSGKLKNAPYTDLSVKYPGGGMLSTVEDLARFGIAFQHDKLVTAESRAIMLTPTKLNDGTETSYGLGWNVSRKPDAAGVYSHSGGQAGTSTNLAVYPEDDIVIAIICNVDGSGDSLGKANRQLLKLARGSEN